MKIFIIVLVIAIIAIIALVKMGIISFAKLKEWLKYAVAIAEQELGSGTGELKLRLVYDLFTDKFTFISKFISFEKFSEYVDIALEWLNDQLQSNEDIAQLIEGQDEDA